MHIYLGVACIFLLSGYKGNGNLCRKFGVFTSSHTNKSTKVLNPRRKYSNILFTTPMRVRGNWPRLACSCKPVVLSVLAPTRASGISRHSFGQG